ncbi:hypothetical protein M3704_04920 [Mannheimia haemolytica]|nr:hypothetical protein M3704_04920 [Mannheimia haemolytica]STY63173.1 Uncharacterised protein [Mannheimia haemolytica]
MKIIAPLTCMKCIQENGMQDLSFFHYAEINNDFRYTFTCPRGHKNTFIDPSHRYETLFQIGATAIIDGYYREAISSFTASLERFYEFFINIKLMKDGINQEVIESIWDKVKSQSERQLGAFIFLYTQHFKEKPNLISNRLIELRNNVTHKGKIPTKNEAIEYGQAILDLITIYLKHILPSFEIQIRKLTFNQLKERNIENVHTATIGPNTILSRINSQDNLSLEKELISLQKWEEVLSNLPQNLNSSNKFFKW